MAGKKTKKKKSAKKKTVKKSKKVAKKTARKKKTKPAQAKSGTSISKSKIIGVVTHYFPHVEAAVVRLKKPLSVGDHILLKGNTTDFKQKVNSMQIDHVPIQKAKKGEEIGLQVTDRVREGDFVLFPD